MLRSTKKYILQTARHGRNGIMFKLAKLYISFLYIEKQARGSLLGQTYSLALKRGGVKKESEIIGGQCMRDTCCHCKVKIDKSIRLHSTIKSHAIPGRESKQVSIQETINKMIVILKGKMQNTALPNRSYVTINQ